MNEMDGVAQLFEMSQVAEEIVIIESNLHPQSTGTVLCVICMHFIYNLTDPLDCILLANETITALVIVLSIIPFIAC